MGGDSPKDASGGGVMMGSPYIPTSMSGGGLSASPHVSSPILYTDTHPSHSLLDGVKRDD